jgi:hypothetical protein
MFRFGTKTLLFAFVLVAVWCSTFGGYSAGRDVRASVLLILFVATGYAAVYMRGAPRAFWSGIFVVMLLSGGNFFAGPVNEYVPNFFWRTNQPTVTIRYATPPPLPPTSAYAPMPADPMASSGQATVPFPAITTVAPQAIISAAATSDYEFVQAVNDTIATLWTLALGFIVGFIGIWIQSSHADRSPS